MFFFSTGSGATCFVGFIGAVWLFMVIGAIVRAVRNRSGFETGVEDERICPDEKCASHNAPYARFCRRCGASLRGDFRRQLERSLNEERS